MTAGRPARRVALTLGVVLALGAAVLLAVLWPRGQSTSAGTRPATNSAPNKTLLATVTRRVPCPPPVQAQRATRRQLRSFVAVAVLACTEEERRYRDGEWTVLIRRATADGLAAFVQSLDRPDAPLTRGACDAVLISQPALALVDRAGRYLYPREPLTSCGQPNRALERLLGGWRPVGSRKVRLQRTTAQIRGHCEQQWKNELALDLQDGVTPGPGGPVLADRPARVLYACVYRAAATDDTVGTFERSVILRGRPAARVLDALAGAAPHDAARCSPPQRFAVISTDAGSSVNVELGGCWLVQRNDGDAVGQAAGSTLARLLGG
jgi:hypothetical protein